MEKYIISAGFISLMITLRYFIVAGVFFLIFYIFKKKKWSYKKIQQRFPVKKDYAREIGYSMLTIVIFIIVAMIVFVSPLRQYTQIYREFSDYGWGYFTLSFFMIILLHDTYFYWMHRMIHHPKLFKNVHRVHHLSYNPSPWAAFAFHPLEAILEAFIIIIVVFLFPVHRFAIIAFIFFMMIYNVYGHLGYELFPKNANKHRILKWFNTSINHNQHHQYARSNYGLYFRWWDEWMGTTDKEYDRTYNEVKNRTV